NAVLAIGFETWPYLHFRHTGWSICSIGYHPDDGRRYVDDGHGGREYSSPFGVGNIVDCGY
ncbi:hypothetical protein K493DRAFT_177837, partial [Basidiobolus meristosporus CBS 931.73]